MFHFSSSWRELSPNSYYQEPIVGGGSEHGWNLTGYVISITLYDLTILQFLTCEVGILSIGPTSPWLFWGWHEFIYRKLGTLQTLYKCFLLYFTTWLSQIMIWLLDTLPNVPPFLLSFWTVCYSSYINCFPTFPCCSIHFAPLFYLTLSDLPAGSSSSAYRSFRRCYEEFYSIEYFLCCVLLFLCICIYISN